MSAEACYDEPRGITALFNKTKTLHPFEPAAVFQTRPRMVWIEPFSLTLITTYLFLDFQPLLPAYPAVNINIIVHVFFCEIVIEIFHFNKVYTLFEGAKDEMSNCNESHIKTARNKIIAQVVVIWQTIIAVYWCSRWSLLL